MSDSPLVLVHGFTAGPRAWDPVVDALREHHDVHALTLDGHLGGKLFLEGPSIAGYLDGIERDLDAARLHRVHVVGNSLGGWIALALAGRGRALSVVALAPAGGWRPGGVFERALLARFALGYLGARALAPSARRLLLRPRLRRAVVSAVVARPERVGPPAALAMVEDLVGCVALVPSLRSGATRNVRALDPVDVPVRIAWSASDRVLSPHWARGRFAELLPDAEQLELRGVGHVPMGDDPGLVARTILEVTAPVA